MNKIFLCCLLFIPIFLSCGKQDAAKYNDSLIQYYNETDSHVGLFYENATRLLSENNLSELPQYAETAIGDIDKCIRNVKELRGPEGSDEYQSAMVAYMEAVVFYIKTMSDEYSQVTDSTNEAEFGRIEKVIQSTLVERTQKNKAIIKAQDIFAQKYNLK